MGDMKKVLGTLIAIFSSIIVCAATPAQDSFFDNYVSQTWGAFGGLTGTTATDIIQTKDGFINIGTYEGLVRFDGVEFNTLKKTKENGLSFVSVRNVIQDSKGDIWIGSNDEGLQQLSRNGNRTFTTKNGLPNNSVRALVEDKSGNIWVGTAAGVVYVTPDGHMMTPQFESGATAQGIIARALYCDTAGRIWLLTANERGLFLFSDGLFRMRPELEPFGSYFVTAITQDLKGKFYLALAENGIVTMNNGVVERIKSGTIIDRVPTMTMCATAQGTIWFGTEKGVVVQDGGEYFEYKDDILGSATINKIISDREGNIWLATDRNGIGKLTHGKFKMHRLGVTVNSLSEDKSGAIWAGTDSGMLFYDGESFKENELVAATKGIRIRDIHRTRNDDLLICCYTKPALIRYGKDGMRSWTTDDGLVGNKVRVAIEAANGDVYAGTTTGLSIIRKDGSIRNFRKADGLENEYIMALLQDSNGVIWIGTDGNGIYLMKDERILGHIDSEDGLVGNVIFKMTQDADGSYWICTGIGVSRIMNFNPEQSGKPVFGNICSENGLGTDSVFQILPESANLWYTSNHGIASAPMEDFLDVAAGKKEKVSAKYYNRNDGLDSDGPTSTARSIVDRHGRLWFTMVDGIAVYDPVRVTKNPVMPLVQIESVTVDNTTYTNLEDSIILKPGTKRIEIKFTGLSFDAPERIQFTHKLTHFEDEFSAPSPMRTLSYTNLSPGKHNFLVNAINGDGFVSEQAKAVLFVQKPHFYQMPIFWIVIFVTTIGSGAAVVYTKQRRMKLENIRLEKMVRQRTSELQLEKEKSDMLIRAILPDKIADELKDGIRSIGENFKDVTILFSDIVGFTKTSSGWSADDIVDALNDIFSRFDERARKCGIEKIKTIGDAYMAASGIPTPRKDHALIMAQFAKGMLEDIEEYNKTARIKFSIRIGMNCGPATAGVIGKTKFIYDVWGDTVNVASRMETAANTNSIRVSPSVYAHLEGSGIRFSPPIECDIKGKGLMTTYEIV